MVERLADGIWKFSESGFIDILNMSLTAAVVILAVMAARLFLRRAPKIFSYGLWAAVLFRLLCPVSFSLPVSFLSMLTEVSDAQGRMEYIPSDVGYQAEPAVQLPISPAGGGVSVSLPEGRPEASVNPMQLYLFAGACVWLLGVAVLLIYSGVSLWRLKRRLREAVYEGENIWRCSGSRTAFVYGIVRPRIYLPEHLSPEEERYILLHEQIHIKRRDPFFRLLSWFALVLHWFNPLVWAAFALSGRDMEMACDEAVIRRLGSGMKKNYTSSLLTLASGRGEPFGLPLAFGERDTGSRIRNVLRYRKPGKLLFWSAAILSSALLLYLAANPEGGEEWQTYYGVVTKIDMGGETSREAVRIPGMGDVTIPQAKEGIAYPEREEQLFLEGDLLRISFSKEKELILTETYPAGFSEEAEQIAVTGTGFFVTYEGADRYRLAIPLSLAPEAETADTLSIFRDPQTDHGELSKDGYRPSGKTELLAEVPVLETDSEGQHIWIELSAGQTEIFLSEFGAGIACELEKHAEGTGTAEDAETAQMQEFLNASSSSLKDLTAENLAEGTLENGMYRVYVRSVSRSAGGIDGYVVEGGNSDEEYPLLAFSEDCVYRLNRELDKANYEEVDFDTFTEALLRGTEVYNVELRCKFQDNLIAEAYLSSALYHYGIQYINEPVGGEEDFRALQNATKLTGEELLAAYYMLVSTEELDVSDAAGTETIEVYTGNVGDGDSGYVFFKDRNGKMLGCEWAHQARAGWNNIYMGESGGAGYILTLHLEDRDNYGEYRYQVYRFGEDGQRLQTAGSSFEWGGQIQYHDNLFHKWMDNLSYYLKNSHLVLSTQEGELRTEKVCEAEKYSYETLRRE